MSTQQYNPANKPGGVPPKDNSNDQAIKIAMIAAILLLLGTTAFFATKFYKGRDVNEAQSLQMDTLNTEIADLETKIKGLELDIQNKGTEVADKDRMLEEKLQEIQQLQSRIASAQSQGKISAGKAQELQGKIANLESMIASYKEEIAKLKDENVQLSGQVSNLTQETATQKQEIETIKREGEVKQQAVEQQAAQQIAMTQEEKKMAQEDAAKKQLELEETKKAASVLKAADFRFLNVKKSGKEKEETDREFKRMWMNTVRTCFTIMENAVAPTGPREVFLVYENPDGSIRTTEKTGKFKFDNRDITYSTKVNINYNRTSQEICMDVPKSAAKDDKFQKGDQTISIFCDGKMIGRGRFEVK